MSKLIPANMAAALTLAALLQAGPAPALAADADSQSVEIHTQDLNLASGSGVAVLRQRIVHAARQVCGPVEIIGTTAYGSYIDCFNVAMRNATQQADRRIATARSVVLFAASGSPK